jgi:hypothetical protein
VTMVRYGFCFLYLTLLAGCGTTMGELDAPPKWCTAPAQAPEPLKAGDDLIQKHAEVKEAAQLERAKNRCLRNYARAVTKT